MVWGLGFQAKGCDIEFFLNLYVSMGLQVAGQEESFQNLGGNRRVRHSLLGAEGFRSPT